MKSLDFKATDIRRSKEVMAFLGVSTPETLFERKLRKILTKSVAGVSMNEFDDSDEEVAPAVSNNKVTVLSRISANHKNQPAEKDLWDLLIDSVYTIVKTREGKDTRNLQSTILSLQKNVSVSLQQDIFSIFDQPMTPIPTPSRVGTQVR